MSSSNPWVLSKGKVQMRISWPIEFRGFSKKAPYISWQKHFLQIPCLVIYDCVEKMDSHRHKPTVAVDTICVATTCENVCGDNVSSWSLKSGLPWSFGQTQSHFVSLVVYGPKTPVDSIKFQLKLSECDSFEYFSVFLTSTLAATSPAE